MRRLFVVMGMLAVSLRAYSADARPGSSAPALSLAQILQASPRTRVDWRELRGKTVVLEFWATWCGPCVANLPHLNELAESLDGSKVRFISVTDESPEVVQGFLAKRKMAGWIGIDKDGETFRRYGIHQRPTTIIVDGAGRIAIVTKPEILTKEKVLRVIYSQGTVAPTNKTPSSSVQSDSSTNGLILGVSLAKSKPSTEYSMSHARDGRMQMVGATAEDLLTWTFGLKSDRLVWQGTLPKQTYDLHASLLNGDDDATFPLIRKAVELGLQIRTEVKTETQSVLVLKATERTKGLLIPTVSSGSMYGYSQGKVHMVNGSMDALAGALETAFHQPVVNETAISGAYDAEVPIPQDDWNEGSKVLSRTLGLVLKQEDRPIQVLIVTPAKSESHDRTGTGAGGGT